jgi:two-component system chemotaxis response regulator CheY
MTLSKILVVEDSELMHRMYDLILFRYKALGATILHANHGQEALHALSKHADVDLILLDLHMPVMDGRAFLGHCKQTGLFQHIPVIVVTTSGTEASAIREHYPCAREYLTKPFHSEELAALIEQIVPVRRRPRASGCTPIPDWRRALRQMASNE